MCATREVHICENCSYVVVLGVPSCRTARPATSSHVPRAGPRRNKRSLIQYRREHTNLPRLLSPRRFRRHLPAPHMRCVPDAPWPFGLRGHLVHSHHRPRSLGTASSTSVFPPRAAATPLRKPRLVATSLKVVVAVGAPSTMVEPMAASGRGYVLGVVSLGVCCDRVLV